MRRKLFLLFAALFALASPMLAADGITGTVKDWKSATAGIGMAIASGLCGLAQGKAVAGAAEAMARNPGATASIRFAMIFGLVFIESLALYTLVIILFT